MNKHEQKLSGNTKEQSLKYQNKQTTDKEDSKNQANHVDYVRPPITLVYARKRGRRGKSQETGEGSGNMENGC